RETPNIPIGGRASEPELASQPPDSDYVASWRMPYASVGCLAFARNGSELLVQTYNLLTLYRIPGGEIARRFRGPEYIGDESFLHTKGIFRSAGCAVSPAGRYYA